MNRKTLVVVGHGMVGHRLVEIAVERGLTAEWDVVGRVKMLTEPRLVVRDVHECGCAS